MDFVPFWSEALLGTNSGDTALKQRHVGTEMRTNDKTTAVKLRESGQRHWRFF